MLGTSQHNGCPPPNQKSVESQKGDEDDEDDHCADDPDDHNDDKDDDGDDDFDESGDPGSKGDGGEDVGDEVDNAIPCVDEDKLYHCDGDFEEESTFDTLLENVSNIRIAARAVARIRSALRMKSFKGINKSLSEEEERYAFIEISDEHIV